MLLNRHLSNSQIWVASDPRSLCYSFLQKKSKTFYFYAAYFPDTDVTNVNYALIPIVSALQVYPTNPLSVTNNLVAPVSWVCNLGIHLDADVTMCSHITKTDAWCFAALCQIRSIHRSVSPSVLRCLVSSLVLSKLDYRCATLGCLSVTRQAPVSRCSTQPNGWYLRVVGTTVWHPYTTVFTSGTCLSVPSRIGTCLSRFHAFSGLKTRLTSAATIFINNGPSNSECQPCHTQRWCFCCFSYVSLEKYIAWCHSTCSSSSLIAFRSKPEYRVVPAFIHAVASASATAV